MGSQATRQLSDLASVRANQGANTPVPEGGAPRGQVDLEAQSVGQVLPTIMADRTGSELAATGLCNGCQFKHWRSDKAYTRSV